MTMPGNLYACIAIMCCWLSAGACAQPALADTVKANPALFSGADREARLLQGARPEGALNVYTSLTVEDITELAAVFEKKYGIKVKYWRASSEKVVQRFIAEARAGRYDVDVIETNGPELEALRREKMLQKVYSPHLADLVPQAILPHGEWVGTRLNMFVQVYNTALVRKDEFPKSYEDLLDPKWKGRLGIEAEDVDWFSTIVKDMGEERGLKLFRAIVARNGLSVRKGHTLLAGLVASGEVPLALTVYNHNADKLKAKGAPLEWNIIPPAVVRANGMALSARPPHPNAAALFYDFMLSDGQAILAKNEYMTASRKSNTLLDKFPVRFVDIGAVLDENAKWEKLYAEIIARQSR